MIEIEKNIVLKRFTYLAIVYFSLVSFFIHLVPSEYGWNDFLSSFVHVKHGPLLEVAMFTLAVIQLIVAYKIRDDEIPTFFLTLGSSGLIMASLFPINPGNIFVGKSALHMLGAILEFFFVPIAIIARKKNVKELMLGGIALILIMFASIQKLLGTNFGILQKFVIIIIVYWIIITINEVD